MLRLRNLAAACGLCLVLVACESAEDRADGYLTSALELIEAGDVDRAIVELRNVFELVPNHVEARLTMARLMVDAGNKSGAFTQYLRLVEVQPENVEGQTVLAEIAFEARDWDVFSRHAEQVVELAPDALRSRIIRLATEYRETVLSSDDPAREALAARAEALLAERPESQILPYILFDSYVRDRDFESALTQLDRLIAANPTARRLYDQRLQLLGEVRDEARIEAHLQEVVDLFPDEIEPKSQLVQYLISRNKLDMAEAFLREISDPTDEEPGFYVDLLRFIGEVRGTDAAREELARAIEVSPNPDQFRMMLAVLDFETGDQQEAISDLQTVIDQAEQSDLKNTMKVAMARMLVATGNEVGARRLVDEVLQADTTHPDALKMQASWLIQSDDTDSAIANLRLVLDANSEDLVAMNLMADAYTRAGSHDLARDFLALAVEASEQAPEPSIRYARTLLTEERYLAAEEVLLAALRRTPNEINILALLGQTFLLMEDYARGADVVSRLNQIDTGQSRIMAAALETELLGRQEGVDQALQFLEEFTEEAGATSQMALLRAQLSAGQNAEALELVQRMVAREPENPNLQYLLASVRATNGDLDGALDILQQLIADVPQRVQPRILAYRILRIQGKVDAAIQMLDEGLDVVPNAPDLLWAKASELEAGGDTEGAISIYERLYEGNTSSTLVANNLASLITTYRDDEASLNRAWTIARRLRGTDVPAFQDTYGWIAFRRGDAQEAVQYLEPAAESLQGDALVQFHLAQVYAALERPEDALAQYRKVLELAGDTDTRPQIQTARDEVARLEQGTTTQDN